MRIRKGGKASKGNITAYMLNFMKLVFSTVAYSPYIWTVVTNSDKTVEIVVKQ
jgi:hypothetical protein